MLIALASPIARNAVKIASNMCPKCRFSLEHFRADRCPECGLFLGPDFHAPPSPTETRATDPEQAGQCSPPSHGH